LTSDGKPYGPFRYKEIARERYWISKYTHTSYTEAGKITPLERDYLKEFIADDIKAQQDAIKKKE